MKQTGLRRQGYHSISNHIMLMPSSWGKQKQAILILSTQLIMARIPLSVSLNHSACPFIIITVIVVTFIVIIIIVKSISSSSSSSSCGGGGGGGISGSMCFQKHSYSILFETLNSHSL